MCGGRMLLMAASTTSYMQDPIEEKAAKIEQK